MPREVPAGMLASLRSGTGYTALAYIVTRRDGRVFGFTDCDRPIVVEGVRCEPESGLDASSIDASVGAEIDGLDVMGLISHDGVTVGDIEAGLWDRAEVRVLRVDWRDPSEHVLLALCEIDEITRQGALFEATLASRAAVYSRSAGRTAVSTCDADFGDARCGKDLAALRRSGAVASVLGPAQFSAACFSAELDGYFAAGVITWDTGEQSEIRVHEGSTVWLWDHPWKGLVTGRQFSVVPGCARTWAACQAWGNAANFRGFPHMPGSDKLLGVGARGAEADESGGGSLFRTDPPPPLVLIDYDVFGDNRLDIEFEPVPFMVRADGMGRSQSVWGEVGRMRLNFLPYDTTGDFELVVLSGDLVSDPVTITVTTGERPEGGD